jgi:branched-chain amino acid transport system permease protein
MPSGVYNRNYREALAIVRTRFRLGLLIGLAIFLASLPLIGGYYLVNLIILMCIFIINTLGFNILLGFAGQINLGHAAFMGVGAYTSAILTSKVGVPFLVSLPLSGLVSGVVGLIFGIPSMRVKGFYLALVTLGAHFILIYVFEHLRITGGTDGMVCSFASVGPFVFDTPSKICWLTMTVAAIMIFFANNLARTRMGRAFVGIRDNDIAAEVLGVNVFYYKLLAFFTGCFYAGISGSLWAHFVTSIHPDQFPFFDSILYLGAIIVGGIGTLFGAITGAILIKGLDEVTRVTVVPMIAESFPAWGASISSAIGPMIYGLVIIIFLIFEPKGLVRAWERVKLYFEVWPFGY